MKEIIGNNVDEGVRASFSFVGLFYRILLEGRITLGQTAYIPIELDWVEYLVATVSYDAEPDVDQSLLRLGAMITSVCWLFDAYSKESFPERTKSVVEALKRSEYGDRQEVVEFLEFIEDLENEPGPEPTLGNIYREYVVKWWKSQIGLGEFGPGARKPN